MSKSSEGGRLSEGEELGRRLREAREYLGLSQEDTAKRLGIPRASVSAFENAQRKVSSLELRELSALYRVPVPQLLGIEELSADRVLDETTRTLFRATQDLTDDEKEQVLRFAQFLRAPVLEKGD